jgi:hypothetical protein
MFGILRQSAAWVGSALLVGLLVGCSSGPSDTPPLGHVSGTILLDGQPLANAQVEFNPAAGRGSVATTDANGQYVLKYTNELEGAVLGTHTVSISTGVAPSSGEGGAGQSGSPERIPPKYNSASEVKEEVKAGSNTFDYKIESGGQTFPTRPDGGAKAPTA